MRVGFIGLGDQGGPMAQRIVVSGHPLLVWARRAETCAPLQALGADVSASARALATHVDLLCLCVTDDAAVRALLIEQGLLEALPDGAIIANHSTIHPDTCQELGAIAARLGKHLIDAPVSGSGHAAIAGELTVMTGGADAAIEAARPVFEAYAGTIIHCGQIGDAMMAKLAHNLIGAANIGLAAKALMTGEASGVGEAAFYEVMSKGAARSNAIDIVRRLSGDGRAGHILSILSKDVALARKALPEAEVRFWGPLAGAGLEALRDMSA